MFIYQGARVSQVKEMAQGGKAGKVKGAPESQGNTQAARPGVMEKEVAAKMATILQLLLDDPEVQELLRLSK